MTRRDQQRGASEIIVFGRHAVSEALGSSGAFVMNLYVLRSLGRAERKRLRKIAQAEEILFQECSRDELSLLTQASRHDQGIAARVRLLRVTEVESLVARATGRAARDPIRLVALDGVTNSQNVGMIVRSVVGAGLDGLLWPAVGVPWVNGLVVRAAAGALFSCPIVQCPTLASGLATLQGAGFRAFGLDAKAERSLFAVEAAHRAVFVLGSESEGLSQEVRGMLDEQVAIPMAGPLESLNVAVTAGLVCFHAAGLLENRTPDAQTK